jgi:hypothetical protein
MVGAGGRSRVYRGEGQAHAGMGVDATDHDNDGRPDLIRHARKNKNHSILVKTIGVGSNRDGIGTEVKVVSGQLTQYDWIRSGASYLYIQRLAAALRRR